MTLEREAFAIMKKRKVCPITIMLKVDEGIRPSNKTKQSPKNVRDNNALTSPCDKSVMQKSVMCESSI